MKKNSLTMYKFLFFNNFLFKEFAFLINKELIAGSKIIIALKMDILKM